MSSDDGSNMLAAVQKRNRDSQQQGAAAKASMRSKVAVQERSEDPQQSQDPQQLLKQQPTRKPQ